MYRIFCESYKNFIDSMDKESYRVKVSEPLSLIVNLDKFKKEKYSKSDLYKKLCDLVNFMNNNIQKFPRLKAFLWTIEARNIKGEDFNVSTLDELQEQTKLVNSFLKLAYWY